MDSMTAVTNPYMGPRVFTGAERNLFFGRDSEAQDLLSLVVSQRLVLFYAQSGAGKSSLLNARLVPGLEERGFLVLPIARVGAEIPGGIREVDNIYLFSLMLSLDQGGGDPARLAHLTLPDFVARLTSDDGKHFYYADPVDETAIAHPVTDEATALAPDQLAIEQYDEPNYVLIIDQFEEIFTAHTHRWKDRARFFEQLDQAMKKDPKMWVMLTLREDYVAALDPYAHQLADKMRARYYMQRMSTEAAQQAVEKPAELAGRPFAAGVAEQLVTNLSQVRVLGEAESSPGQYVEPVQLQVVCYQLWENLKHNPHEQISRTELEAYGNIDNALSDFYNRTINEVLSLRDVHVSNSELRLWFSKKLITDAGTRSTIVQEEEKTGGIPNNVVKALTDRYLIRAEPRAGAIWIELIHDRLVEPIRWANRAVVAARQRRRTIWWAVGCILAIGFAVGALYLSSRLYVATEALNAAKVQVDAQNAKLGAANVRLSDLSEKYSAAANAQATAQVVFATLVAQPVTTQIAPATAAVQQATAQAAVRQANAAQATVQAAVAQATVQAAAPQEMSLGLSVGGRDIPMIRVGNPDGSAVVVVGSIEGFEQADTSQPIQQLADWYRSQPHEVPTSAVLYLIPSINPDGIAASSRLNVNQVDLNRNWDTSNWRSDAPQPCCPNGQPGTGGKRPFSEPELIALRDLLIQLSQSGRKVYFIVLHSTRAQLQGQVLPGYTKSGMHPASKDMADLTSLALGYSYSEEFGTYTPTGEAIGWAAENSIPSVDIIMPHNNGPSPDQMINALRGILQ
jgi:hypothetical protein